MSRYQQNGYNQIARPTRSFPSQTRAHISGRARGKGYRNTHHRRPNKRYKRSANKLCTTQSKYILKETIKDAIKPNEVHMEANKSSVQEYVDHVLDLFDKQQSLIYITATIGMIGDAINCVEIIKRKKYGLHQQSSIEIRKVKEIWQPLEYHLKQVFIEYELTYVQIILTFDDTLINKNSIGYQQPEVMFGNVQKQFMTLQKKYDDQKQELKDARKLHKNLQNTYDTQQQNFLIYMDKFEHKSDEPVHLRETKENGRVKKQMAHVNQEIVPLEQFQELQNKYEIQKEELAMMRAMRTKYSDDFKVMKSKYNALQQKYEKLQNILNIKKKGKFDGLNGNELVELIVSFDKDIFEKYRNGLVEGFMKEGVDGSCLKHLTKDDLYGFGVVKFADKIAMYHSIKRLFET